MFGKKRLTRTTTAALMQLFTTIETVIETIKVIHNDAIISSKFITDNQKWMHNLTLNAQLKRIGILEISFQIQFVRNDNDGMSWAKRCVKNKGSLKNERILVMTQIIYMRSRKPFQWKPLVLGPKAADNCKNCDFA